MLLLLENAVQVNFKTHRHGVFADKDDFFSYLRESGFLFHSEADEIGDAEILTLWQNEKKKSDLAPV